MIFNWYTFILTYKSHQVFKTKGWQISRPFRFARGQAFGTLTCSNMNTRPGSPSQALAWSLVLVQVWWLWQGHGVIYRMFPSSVHPKFKTNLELQDCWKKIKRISSGSVANLIFKESAPRLILFSSRDVHVFIYIYLYSPFQCNWFRPLIYPPITWSVPDISCRRRRWNKKGSVLLSASIDRFFVSRM